MEQNRKPRKKPMHIWVDIKEVRIYNSERTVSSTHGVGKTLVTC